MDSLDKIEFVLNLEETYNIAIPEEDAKAWDKIADIIDYIQNLKGVN